MRGYFGIGIVGTKTAANVGTLWRTAYALEAAFIFTAGRRFPHQATDTIKAWKHVPMYEYPDWEAALAQFPRDCVPVGVEIVDRAIGLPRYRHPERAVYILGAEDTGIPPNLLERCRDVVSIPSQICLNVGVAGSIVLYDRIAKAV